MTPTEFTAALDTLGWSRRELARRLACDTNLPARWAAGATIPPAIETWLGAWVRFAVKHPAPEWRVRGRTMTATGDTL